METLNILSKQTSFDLSNIQLDGVHKISLDSDQSKVKQNDKNDRYNKMPDNSQLNELTKDLNNAMDTLNLNIEFGYNDKINALFVNVSEKNSGKLIRKIPTEEAMHLSEQMQILIGTIFDKKG